MSRSNDNQSREAIFAVRQDLSAFYCFLRCSGKHAFSMRRGGGSRHPSGNRDRVNNSVDVIGHGHSQSRTVSNLRPCLVHSFLDFLFLHSWQNRGTEKIAIQQNIIITIPSCNPLQNKTTKYTPEYELHTHIDRSLNQDIRE